jgi:DNA-binding NarL/FixJ family response regulator
MIRILVVDDHPIVRDGLVGVLEDQPDFEVIGSVGSAEDALNFVTDNAPDVVLLDLEMSGMSGIEAIPHLLLQSPNLSILIFTAYDTDERVLGAIKAGAKGYLLKGASADEIAKAIRILGGGGSYLEPRVAAKVMAEIGSPRSQRALLSPREAEILRLVSDGLPNKQIASSLGITERTVRFHMTSIFAKLGADNRAQAVSLAVHQGLL